MISILMATFNGEKYIREQIDSLLAQTCQDFVLFINDDCSSDGTFAVLEEYIKKCPDKIRLSRNMENTGSAKHNFIKMMIEVKDEYVMLCDQDDVWMPDKIEVTLDKMKQMESDHGKELPLLVHTDLKNVDENLKPIADSYFHYMNADYHKTALHQQVIQNTLTGCTAMYNRALADRIVNQPSFMVMHDWYLMLIASAFGEIGTLEETTILYRQHGENVVGVKNMNSPITAWKLLLKGKRIKRAIRESFSQADGFYAEFNKQMNQEQQYFFKQYLSIPSMGKLNRIKTVCRLKSFKNGLMRNLGFFLFL